MTARTALLAGLAAALAGCASCDTVPADAVEDCASSIALGGARTDILFVIDDSTSMGGEQTLLRNGLYDFIQALAASPIATDYHIGVTTSSVVQWTDAQTTHAAGPSAGVPYAAGTLVAIARDGAGNPLPGEFVYLNGAYGGPRILASGQPTLVADFEANVLVGVDGSNREQPFRAVQRALEQAVPGGVNDGFLRPGARLAIVFLSDEDDCSGPSAPTILTSADCRAAKAGSLLTPVADVAAFLQGPIGGEVRDVVVAAIVGVAPGTLQLSCGGAWCSNNACSTATDEGARFVELLGQFPLEDTRLASICDSNFDAALADIAEAIIPDTLPLEGTPADWRLLAVSLDRPGTGAIPCTVALDGSAEAPAADAVFVAPQEGRPASLRFQNACALQRDDRVDVQVVCAG